MLTRAPAVLEPLIEGDGVRRFENALICVV